MSVNADWKDQTATPGLPLLSVILPVFNEQILVADHVRKVVNYLNALESEFRWEVLVVNDGSVDDTTRIIDELADEFEGVYAIHHPKNFGLGQALKFGFNNTKGDYVVTLDIDLSYDVDHIGELARAIRDNRAKIVLASPYMRGGEIRNVPWVRRVLSVLGNRFLSFFAKGHYSTLTSMVRAYDGNFIRSVNLRSMSMDIMPEVINKSMILGGSILEIPGRLDWGPQHRITETRSSSMKIVKHIFATVFAGFIFRPFLFFIIPGLAIGAFSAFVNFWMFVHYFDALETLRDKNGAAGFSDAFAAAYQQFPHTFVFGLLTAMLSVQLIGLGILAVQSKQYFDELFDLGSQASRLRYRQSKR